MTHPYPMVPEPYEVVHIWEDIKDTYTMEVKPQGRAEIPQFASGQFNMLYVFGVGEIPVSISGDPNQRSAFTHTTRAVGAVSRAICQLHAGAIIGLRGPYGSHWPVAEATGKDVVIVAGGIGLAPLRSAVREILISRQRFARVSILYGARSVDDILFRQELEAWRARFDIDVYVTVDQGGPTWRGSVGVVTRFISRAAFDPTKVVAMTCGPEVMMKYTARELEGCGVGDHAIYVSMERNMKCAVGLCGHCQFAPFFVCKDGPIFPYHQVKSWLAKEEI